MGTLVLVRHAQAAFGEKDYDQLTELGQRQGRRLGELWSAQKLGADRVYSGPRRRQIQTALAVGAEMERAGVPWPELKVLDQLDEYGLDLTHRLPELASSPKIAPLLESMQGASGREEKKRVFQRVLQAVMTAWARGEVEGPDVEPFEDFRSRVEAALERLTSTEGKGERIVAFSSAGTIGTMVGRILKAPLETQLELGWAMSNCSTTDVLFSGSRLTISRFNALDHLADLALRSYR